MKRLMVSGLSWMIIALLISFAISCGRPSANERTTRISISGAWALYPLVQCWIAEYGKTHPEVIFDISAGGAGKGMTDVLSGAVGVGMVSRALHPEEEARGAFGFVVARDAVVPTMNAAAPAALVITRCGVSKTALAALWMTDGPHAWSAIAPDAGNGVVNVYTRSDACGAAQTWAEYLGGKQEDLRGTAVYGDPGLAEAVRRDVNGVGFNNICFTYGADGRPVPGIVILPIDLDGDGTLSPQEDFYGTRAEFLRAVAEHRYPSPPARDLYLVTRGRPTDPAIRNFLSWILTEGQRHVLEHGYITVPEEILNEGRRRLE
jgi:phosphate transport system substrate-binding protein